MIVAPPGGSGRIGRPLVAFLDPCPIPEPRPGFQRKKLPIPGVGARSKATLKQRITHFDFKAPAGHRACSAGQTFPFSAHERECVQLPSMFHDSYIEVFVVSRPVILITSANGIQPRNRLCTFDVRPQALSCPFRQSRRVKLKSEMPEQETQCRKRMENRPSPLNVVGHAERLRSATSRPVLYRKGPEVESGYIPARHVAFTLPRIASLSKNTKSIGRHHWHNFLFQAQGNRPASLSNSGVDNQAFGRARPRPLIARDRGSRLQSHLKYRCRQHSRHLEKVLETD